MNTVMNPVMCVFITGFNPSPPQFHRQLIPLPDSLNSHMNSLFSRLIISVVWLLLAGCSTGTSDSTPSDDSPVSTEATPSLSQTEPTPTADSDDSEDETIVDEAFLITEAGFGLAQLGMTLGELKQAMPPDTEYIVESPFMVDFDAITVRQGDTDLFHILYFAGDSFTDDSIVQGLITEHTSYQTMEGVGVETPIQTAEAAYGNATLSYSWANEGREFVRFENPPAPNLSFRVWQGDAPSVDFVGIYSSTTAEYNETEEYAEDAAIKAIVISCIAEACAL